jgi:hypothetical protein
LAKVIFLAIFADIGGYILENNNAVISFYGDGDVTGIGGSVFTEDALHIVISCY